MKRPRLKFLLLGAGAAALSAMPRSAWAQAYPSRPISMIVGAPAGGPTDIVARIMAEPMRASDQCMLPSPSRTNCVSTPSARNASARAS